MKKIFLISFILSVFTLVTAFTFETDFDFSTKYNNNVINLSDEQITIFEDGLNKDKYKLETRDDLINDIDIDFSSKYYFLKHTQIVGIKFDYQNYMKNSILDRKEISFYLKQYFSPEFYLVMNYAYFPKKFVNRYKSVLDNEQYRDFDYEKNQYGLLLQYRLNKKLRFVYNFKFSQLFYNEYFTEYDADKLINSIGLKYKYNQNFTLNVDYGFIKSNAQAEQAYKNLDVISKDPSYIQHNYEASLYITELYKIMKRRVSLLTKIDFNHKSYDSPYLEDEYHVDRTDNFFSFSSKAYYRFKKKIDFYAIYSFDHRNTSSPFDMVESDKSYKANEFGLGISLEF